MIIFDVESKARVDLKRVGGRNYWLHPSSEVICLCWYDTNARAPAINDWAPGYDEPYWADDPDVILAAHNGRFFDRYALRKLRWPCANNPLIDTSDLARRLALPGALDALNPGAKDKAGSKLTKSLSTARRPTKNTAARAPLGAAITAAEWKTYTKAEKMLRGVQAEITPEVLTRVIEYCRQDVRVLVDAWPMLEPALSEFSDFENEVLVVSDIINDRGVPFDRELAERLLLATYQNIDSAIVEYAAELEIEPDELREIAGSPKQFTAVTGAPNAQAKTIEDIIRAGVEPAATFARARQAMASIAGGKLEAGLSMNTDGVLYDTLVYGGAHTLRWSGRGMQLHNLPRPDGEMEAKIKSPEDVSALVTDVMIVNPKRRIKANEIDVLLRATLVAPPGDNFVVGDYSGVESRMLAWVAGDTGELDRISRGVDPYKDLAVDIYRVAYADVIKIQRAAGKIGVLACGYGGGPNALIKMALQNGVDFEAAGTTPQQVVDAWRAKHDPIVKLWRAVEDAFKECWETGEAVDIVTALAPGSLTCVADVQGGGLSTDISIFLPSGRPIIYRDVRKFREKKPGDPQARPRDVLKYRSPAKGGAHVPTYGGKLVENIIQAMCREVLASAMVQAEAAGLRPVLTVHDEIVNAVRADLAESWGRPTLKKIMGPAGLDPWAKGFPVGNEIWVGERYMK